MEELNDVITFVARRPLNSFSFRYPADCSVGWHPDTTSISLIGRYPAACCVGASFSFGWMNCFFVLQ